MVSAMKHTKILIASLAAGVAIVAGFTVSQIQTHAAEPTSQKLQQVAAQCNIVKTRLDNAIKTETAVRIKHGRGYDRDLLPYISAINNRVRASGADTPELDRITTALQAAAGPDGFGNLYTVYADDLESAGRSNCERNPAETYGWIEKARIDRSAVAAKVEEIDGLIGEYITELKKLEDRFTPAINKPKGVPEP